MNPNKMTQLEVDRLVAKLKAIELMREAQKILVEHLNNYYDDKPLMEPLTLLTNAVTSLKETKASGVK